MLFLLLFLIPIDADVSLVVVCPSIIERGVSWRWIFWVMMIFAAACTLIALLFLPETYAPIILLKKVRCHSITWVFVFTNDELGQAFT